MDVGYWLPCAVAHHGRRWPALAEEGDGLSVIITATLKFGKTPCCISAASYEHCTQPPGILTWAAMVLYEVAKDLDLLKRAHLALSLNNDALYAERVEKSGLCTWSAWDMGWDTSPRWDFGEPRYNILALQSCWSN